MIWLVWLGRYIRLRMRLHGLACRKEMLSKEDHDHTWGKVKVQGKTYTINARYRYGTKPKGEV